MAHYAKLDEFDTVVAVNVVDNDQEEYLGGEEGTVAWLKEGWGGADWKKCSYNTVRGGHLLGGTPLRKNFPSMGFIYDRERDAFVPPPPRDYYIFDEETCTWVPPLPCPDDGKDYYFDVNLYESSNGEEGWVEYHYEN